MHNVIKSWKIKTI